METAEVFEHREVGRVEAVELPERRELGFCVELLLGLSIVSAEADVPGFFEFA